jgi:hypothetical protein
MRIHGSHLVLISAGYGGRREKGFGRFGGRRLLGKLNEHPIGALTVRLPRKGKPTVEF